MRYTILLLSLLAVAGCGDGATAPDNGNGPQNQGYLWTAHDADMPGLEIVFRFWTVDGEPDRITELAFHFDNCKCGVFGKTWNGDYEFESAEGWPIENRDFEVSVSSGGVTLDFDGHVWEPVTNADGTWSVFDIGDLEWCSGEWERAM